MRWLLRLVMFVFMSLLTVAIFVYAALFVLVNTPTLERLHRQYPAMQYISSFLGVYTISDMSTSAYEDKQDISSTLAGRAQRRNQRGYSASGKHRLQINVEDEVALYAPVWQVNGSASAGLEDLQVLHHHPGRDSTTEHTISFQPAANSTGYQWERAAHLGKETIYQGVNEYTFIASYADGETITRTIRVEVNYDRIAIGDRVLYVDAAYPTDQENETMIRSADDFEGSETDFITYGCDPDNQVGKLLLQEQHQYRIIPACLSFSLAKTYIQRYVFRQETNDAWEYDIMTMDEGVLYRNFPLFVKGLHTVYMSLAFWDPQRALFHILQSRGDEMSYALEITRYDPHNQKTLLKITHTDGNQLLVENDREKMFIYLYKDRSYMTGLLWPGIRYQFWFQGTQINQGPMYTLPIRVYAPQRAHGSTFQFTIALDGDILSLDDGIKIMQFDVYHIGTSIQVADKVSHLAVGNPCDNVRRDIYQNTRGDDLVGATVRDTLWVTLAGAYVPQAMVHHVETDQYISLEQLYQGYGHLRIRGEQGTMISGDNTYELVLYDADDHELCRLSKTISLSP